MHSDILNSFILGSLSGTISALMFQPLDVVKTRLQHISKCSTGTHVSYFNIFKNIYNTQGITGFWKGLSPTLVRCIPGVGMYFCTLHVLNKNINREEAPIFQTILVGAMARASSTFCFMPFTILKTRFESGEYHYRGLFHALHKIYQTEGWRGFSRGLVPTIVRDVPFSGLYYLFYTRMKIFAGINNSTSNFSMKIWLCGISAGCLASFITQPADVIKTYMQLYPKEFSHYSSGLYFIYQKFGISGYFNGLFIRLTRRTLVTSMSWTVYERINKWIRQND
ncbi:hypothetical protein PGB90_010174 [Kerria lacca]